MSNTIVLKKGLDVPVKGAAEKRLSKTIIPGTVAVRPADFKGLLPRLLVKEGDRVLAGSPVLSDKKNPAVLVCSPVSGEVSAIVRGEKRKLLAVLVKTDDKQEYHQFGIAEAGKVDARQIKELLLASGLWPLLIQRPYGIIANPDAAPKGIFVSTWNSAPLAPDAEFCYAQKKNAIQAAVSALSKIAPVHLSHNAKDFAASSFSSLKDCEHHVFKGKHPAGNVGVQISWISPIRKDETVWTVSMAGLAAIGELLLKGRVNLLRKVAVTGPMAIETAYIETVPGMPMSALAPFYGVEEGVRIISGNVLSGRTEGAEGYLGFHDCQVTLIHEGTEPELLGWIRPIRYKQFSTDHCYFSWLMPWRKYDMDTNLHGGARAFLMTENYYQKVLPMDLYPIYLVKACLAQDIDKMEKFGIYEVLPEDFATVEFVDPSKNDIQSIIAQGIDLMLKEMA